MPVKMNNPAFDAGLVFFVVGGTVFKLLLFVPELGKLALIGGDLGFQFRDGLLFQHNT